MCFGNLHRGPTAERLLHEVDDLEVKSAGTHPLSPVIISRELLEWADVIFAMGELEKSAVFQVYPQAETKIILLDIPDIYRRDEPALVSRLRDKLSPYFGEI